MSGSFKTGIPAVDHYLASGYGAVRGFSSKFSATICGHLMRRQSELGVHGSVAEIGTFEGRFFIALGLALGAGEHAYGFDLFAWPGSNVLERLLANTDAHGLARDEARDLGGAQRFRYLFGERAEHRGGSNRTGPGRRRCPRDASGTSSPRPARPVVPSAACAAP